MMIAKKTLLASSVALATLGLVACGGGGGDSQDSSSADQTSFTGLVIDGRIANGFVWIDTDDDGAIDLYEPYAYTDAQGYYSYNPETKVNYCADTSHQNCLNTGIVDGETKIKIAGGIDLDSGESFQGVMVLKTTRAEAREQESQIPADSTNPAEKPSFIPLISPLTSLLSEIDESDYATMLNRVGVDTSTTTSVSDLLKRDYSNLSDTTDLTLVKASYRVQKIVDSMAVILDERSNNREVNIGLTSSSSPSVTSSSEYVMQALAEKLKSQSANDSTALDNVIENNLSDVVSDAVTRFSVKVAKLDTSNTEQQVVDKLSVSSISDEMTTIVKQVKNTIDTKMNTVTTTDKGALKVAILASETLVSKVKKEAANLAADDKPSDGKSTVSESITSMATKVSKTEFDDAIKEQVVTNNRNIEVSILADEVEGLDDSTTDFSSAADNSRLGNVPASGEAGVWANRALSLSGVADGGKEFGRIMIFFKGSDNSATKGDMSLCYAHNATKDSEDVKGELFTGTWEEIGNRGTVSVDSGIYTFHVSAVRREKITLADDKANFLGLDLNGASKGAPGDNNIYSKFRFKAGEDSDLWYSDLTVSAIEDENTDNRDWGLISVSSIPTTQEGCRTFAFEGVENALTKNLGF